jgi:protein associated with RNAse G/E
MELTQEYFDQQLQKLATKEDLNAALETQTKELKDYIHESFATQQQYIDERFNELMDQTKVKEDVALLKTELAQIKAALHLS